MKLLYKLLLSKLSPMQFIGFVLANIVGAVIILFGVRAYQDVSATFEDPDGAIANNYLVITPGVNIMGDNSFSDEELAELRAYPGVEAVGEFETATFKVNADLSGLGIPVTTAMFIESVPDEFLDVDLRSWTGEVYGDDMPKYIRKPSLFVPVILPRSYITVYNFGFASSRGTPQMNEAHIKALSFYLRCRNIAEDVDQYYNARIVGFTDRINTIIVPQDFLRAAEQKYGTGVPQKPSRLIIKPDGSNDDAILKFVSEKKYHYDGTGADTMKIVSLVKGIAFVVILLGLVVSLLAFFLLVVSIHLLIEKNKEKNATLIALGYTHDQVCRPYTVAAVVLNLVSMLIAVITVAATYGILENILLRYNPAFVGTGMGPILIVAAVLLGVFCLLHALMIRKEVHE